MTAVLDASALLALLFNEPGAEPVANAIAAGATVGTVNLAEVATVLVRNDRALELLDTVRGQVTVEAFTSEDATAAAVLYPRVASRGLSLGDRACLALADRLTAPAITAERIWADLALDTTIECIRPTPNDKAPGGTEQH
ncbi:MAG: PIN domain-containing protein [Nocardioidaceae bacterium]